jgi:transcriptional regulator with GAF, ATPase, and Fis domain
VKQESLQFGFLGRETRSRSGQPDFDEDLMIIELNDDARGQFNASRNHMDKRAYPQSENSSEYNFEEIVGRSSAFKKVLEQVRIVAPTDATVLLHGETGTGKELVARAIHNLSFRRQRTFVRLNCVGVPSGLLESQLFGHETGAFTGALMQKKGRFERTDTGSLFLDEIGDINLELQQKLLRSAGAGIRKAGQHSNHAG